MISIASLLSLFLLSIVNQIIIPAPVDLIMLGLVKIGHDPILVVLTIVVGSTLGATVDYFLGKLGIEKVAWLKRKTESKGYKKARRFYDKYGSWTLLFSYAPFVGKYFVFIAGIMKTKFIKVIFLYVFGKLLYYAVAGYLVLNIWR